jgi:hypothetical protein
MAIATGFTVNDNVTTKNTDLIDLFIEPHIFMNELIKNRSELILNSKTVEIDSRYDYRPDRMAYEHYGQDFWYPAILIANNIGSILQFKAKELGFSCRIPSADVIKEIINIPDSEHLNLTEFPVLFKNK